MTTETLFIFFMAIVLLHIKPGPGQAMRISTALEYGFMPAFLMALGVMLVCSLYLIIAALGAGFLSDLLKQSGFYFRLLGGAYLIYLGVKGLKKLSVTVSKDAAVKKQNLWQYFVMGCVVSLSNPIDIVFFAGILPALMDLSALTLTDVALLVVIMVVTCLVIDILILSFVVQSRTALIDSGYGKTVSFIASGGLILIGLFFIYSAIFLTNYTFEIF